MTKQWKTHLASAMAGFLLLSLTFFATACRDDISDSSSNAASSDYFVILAKTGIDSASASDVTGNMGVSPVDSTGITGFSLTMDASNVFSTSTQVHGKIYAADYAAPTPANLTAAIGSMELAYTTAAGLPPDVTELGAGNIGGMTLAPGVYKWGGGLLIPTDVTLSGTATDTWTFQIADTLTISNGVQVLLAGSAQPQNVTWQVATNVVLGTTAHLAGTVLAGTDITLGTGATVYGRLQSQTAVNISGNTVVAPTP